MRVGTTATTYRARLEAAETALDDLMVQGRGIVEYTEPGTGVRVKKDPQQLREYISYLTERVATTSAGASSRTLAAFGRPR